MSANDDEPGRGSALPEHGAAASRPTQVRRLIFALSCMTSLVLYLHRYTWGFVKADVQREFGWSEWQLGLLDGLFNASYAVGQIPSGILCDWFGPHVLLGSIAAFIAGPTMGLLIMVFSETQPVTQEPANAVQVSDDDAEFAPCTVHTNRS